VAGRTPRTPDIGYGAAVLLDNSAWARVGLGRLAAHDAARWEGSVRADEIVVCPPFALEALYSARGSRDYLDLESELEGFRRVTADERTWVLAADAQRALATASAVSHRVKPIDLLLAAVAHQHGLGVLHYDHDYDTIGEHTPLRFRSVWVARRGTVA